MLQNTAARTTRTQGRFISTTVVIVGAGPTGLTAGNLLGMSGIDTLILERNADLSDCPKAISIDDEGLRTCQALGLSNEVTRRVLLDIGVHYLSGTSTLARVAPISRRNGYPLISTFHQPAFEATLLQGLDRFPCVEVLFQHTLETFEQDKQRVLLSVRTFNGELLEIECSYLLACDGGKSPIRHALGIPMRSPPLPLPWLGRAHKEHTRGDVPTDSGYEQAWHRKRSYHTEKWLVVDCVNDDDTLAAAMFFCNPARPAVTVPAPHHARRWEFMLLPDEQAEDLLNAESIYALIQQTRQTHGLLSNTRPRIIRQTAYAFHAALAATFARGRVFLLGDAAHLMPPFGGQGMNSGLRDAHNLCWKLCMVLRGLAQHHLLATYHEERSPHVAQMILFSALLGKVAMSTSRRVSAMRDLFFRILNTLPAVRASLTELRVKPQPKHREGFFLPGFTKQSRALTGLMVPQPHILDQKGRDVLLDDVLGDGFALLKLCSTRRDDLTFSILRNKQPWQRLGVRLVCIHDSRSSMQALPVENDVLHVVTTDREQSLQVLLHHNRNLCILVRPDRYIMGAFALEHTDMFSRLLEAKL